MGWFNITLERVDGQWIMKYEKWALRIKSLIFISLILCLGSAVSGDVQKQISEQGLGSGKFFLYTAKKLGVPILTASLMINNGSYEQGKPIYHIQVDVKSLPYFGFLFRMKNRFTSTVESETCFPIRYRKEIDQEGLLIEKKNYFQTLTFDYPNKKMVLETPEKKEKQEFPLLPDTYDPLSMFARCYLKEDLDLKREIQMSIHDGLTLRQIVFHLKKERIRSKMFGEVEAVCLESTTSFSSFGEKDGIIRIWYTADGKKTPILMELDLPVGNVKFELEEVREG
jgi:hypothetical protein